MRDEHDIGQTLCDDGLNDVGDGIGFREVRLNRLDVGGRTPHTKISGNTLGTPQISSHQHQVDIPSLDPLSSAVLGDG